ncbi:cold shock and DUF1294 domain-containing protein [Lysobacter sp. A6]|uniref:Cold shock and DUF1294 domain-containing protein n=1 Tax=Noviluteimonas lactosilytica TaxID=2888523 RepID=A0ABS8JGT9_9GAMM|nr:cold shock and DUF1294 domain-containing protein [Lysobacter lactosilyticus]MCC8362821.1 cold shock and DUF1294 domain-containing protein [Lysobacter lactosilyticus]
MRYAGRLTDWNDDKGYGFVVPNGGGDRAFVHVKAFERASRRPVVGDLLSYEAERDEKGRVNAARVRFAGQTVAPVKTQHRDNPVRLRRPQRIVLALASIAAFSWLGWSGKLPVVMLFVYGFMSVVAIALYAGDKRTARDGQWRTPEDTLHAVALFGGWPGALLAQGVLGHKSNKASFQTVFWSTVVLNLLGAVLLLRYWLK